MAKQGKDQKDQEIMTFNADYFFHLPQRRSKDYTKEKQRRNKVETKFEIYKIRQYPDHFIPVTPEVSKAEIASAGNFQLLSKYPSEIILSGESLKRIKSL